MNGIESQLGKSSSRYSFFKSLRECYKQIVDLLSKVLPNKKESKNGIEIVHVSTKQYEELIKNGRICGAVGPRIIAVINKAGNYLFFYLEGEDKVVLLLKNEIIDGIKYIFEYMIGLKSGDCLKVYKLNGEKLDNFYDVNCGDSNQDFYFHKYGGEPQRYGLKIKYPENRLSCGKLYEFLIFEDKNEECTMLTDKFGNILINKKGGDWTFKKLTTKKYSLNTLIEASKGNDKELYKLIFDKGKWIFTKVIKCDCYKNNCRGSNDNLCVWYTIGKEEYVYYPNS